MVNFYSFGTEDDSTLGSSDEATSGREYLDEPICFYGVNQSHLVVSYIRARIHIHEVYHFIVCCVVILIQVYTNGFITLGGFYNNTAYIPKVLKTTGGPIIAPFFADADTRGYRSGMIYFRQTKEPSLLERAKQDIEFTFPGTTFTPKHLYIVTWDKIGFYNHHDNLVSTSMCVLVAYLFLIILEGHYDGQLMVS